ncbi:7005_t:CDS:2 [Ambispora gerdemannii]|uniref:7005_t:CDS:1 n=1 Tax=Ambispora gerdemannii TaxID=144530 RepID=A0A9N9F633_9GLOM|nr:7005_t:CDS:2 [Ambispora gerdemannii]
MTDPLSNEIEKCLELLGPSTSDEEKFVALMLLPRLLQQDPNNVKVVFEAMDFKFLERLLRTKSSTTSEVSETTLKAIAVQIIYCFCGLDELLSKKQLFTRIPSLANSITPNDNNEMTKDILKIFMRLSSVQDALIRMTETKTLSKILLCVTSSQDEEVKNLGLLVIRHIAHGILTILAKEEKFQNTISLEDTLSPILFGLSSSFRINQIQLKFDILETLTEIFSNFPEQGNINFKPQQSTIWLQNMRFGLREILSSRIGPQQRDMALSLIHHLLFHFGAEWLFASPGKPESKDTKFGALVVQLACVEIRLILDELAEQQSKNNIDINSRHEQTLPACYFILEKTIEYLSQISEGDDEESAMATFASNFDPDLLLRLRSTMTETFRIILEYLIDVKNGLVSIEQAAHDSTILASIRVLSAWLSEEDSLEKEVSSIMPLFIDLARYRLKNNMDSSLLNILTPAFLNLTSQDAPREAFIDHNGQDILFTHITKTWPNFLINDFETNYNNLLGPLQILLNLLVAERENFIAPNENEIWEIVKIGEQIVQVFGSKLKSEGYPPSMANQMILIANTLLFCLLVISSTEQFDLTEKATAENITRLAVNFYQDKKKLMSEPSILRQIEELVFLGERIVK